MHVAGLRAAPAIVSRRELRTTRGRRTAIRAQIFGNLKEKISYPLDYANNKQVCGDFRCEVALNRST